jgi:DNA-directed RNA polymerase specialized sigma24 family protein
MSGNRMDASAARMMRGRGVSVDDIAQTLDRPVAWVKRALGDAQRKPSKQKYERKGYAL